MNPVQASAGGSITTLSSREVYRNHWMRVREDEILRSNGAKGIYGVVDKDDSAIILPLDEGGCGWWSSFVTPSKSGRWSCPKAAGRWKSSFPKNWRAAN